VPYELARLSVEDKLQKKERVGQYIAVANTYVYMRFEVLREVKMKVLFWVVTPC
jgi:hypothetical protein